MTLGVAGHNCTPMAAAEVVTFGASETPQQRDSAGTGVQGVSGSFTQNH